MPAISRLRLLLIPLVVVLAAVSTTGFLFSSVQANSVDPLTTAGLVPPATNGSPTQRVSPGGNLIQHGGPVMRTNTTYAIYWLPPGFYSSPNYVAVINQYFTDVAADSGKTTNVYTVDREYGDRSGSGAYASTFGGFFVETAPFPADGCKTALTSICLTDQQIQAEIAQVMLAHGWQGGLGNVYALFTPRDVAICFNKSGSSCSYTQFCGYHGRFLQGSPEPVIYAALPYAADEGCDTGGTP